MKMNSNDILKLLELRHKDDILIEECYSSPNGNFRMDAWVIAGYWSRRKYIGYEIKVSRSDFVHDDKWRNYLKYCNEFYFVCPFGLIQPEELPQDTGLAWVAKNTSMIRIKRKAPTREIVLQDGIWFNIVKNRMEKRRYPNTSLKEHWEYWLKNKIIDRDFGYRVSRSIRQKRTQ